jgi:hypothetical protein
MIAVNSSPALGKYIGSSLQMRCSASHFAHKWCSQYGVYLRISSNWHYKTEREGEDRHAPQILEREKQERKGKVERRRRTARRPAQQAKELLI